MTPAAKKALAPICEETGRPPEDFIPIWCRATRIWVFRLTPKARARDELARKLWRRKKRELEKRR